jgi:hypothetical protein
MEVYLRLYCVYVILCVAALRQGHITSKELYELCIELGNRKIGRVEQRAVELLINESTTD